jgi:hypothetical protein
VTRLLGLRLLRVARAMQTSERGLAGNLFDENTLERTLTDGLKGILNLRADALWPSQAGYYLTKAVSIPHKTRPFHEAEHALVSG